MAQTCTICRHPQRAAIDRALVSGEAYRGIAARFSVSESSVLRHREAHLPASLVAAAGEEAARQALDVIEQLRAINGASLQILSEARRANDPGLALRAVDRIQRQIELQAKLLADVEGRPEVSPLASAEWHAIRTALLSVLRPYPEAAAAVAEALLRLDGAEAGGDAGGGHAGD